MVELRVRVRRNKEVGDMSTFLKATNLTMVRTLVGQEAHVGCKEFELMFALFWLDWLGEAARSSFMGYRGRALVYLVHSDPYASSWCVLYYRWPLRTLGFGSFATMKRAKASIGCLDPQRRFRIRVQCFHS